MIFLLNGRNRSDLFKMLPFNRGLGGRVTFLGFGNVFSAEAEKERERFWQVFRSAGPGVSADKKLARFSNR
jgi:hypothetical protein